MDNVKSLGMKRNELGSLVQELKDVIYKRAGHFKYYRNYWSFRVN